MPSACGDGEEQRPLRRAPNAAVLEGDEDEPNNRIGRVPNGGDANKQHEGRGVTCGGYGEDDGRENEIDRQKMPGGTKITLPLSLRLCRSE